jgi:PAS domain S-box-containing protein
LLQTLLESPHEQAYAVNRDQCIVYVNPSFAEMLGISREKLPGKTLLELEAEFRFPLHFVDSQRTEVLQVLKTGKPTQGERAYPTSRGVQHFAYSCQPVFGETEQVEFALFLATDITEKKRTEQRLAEHQERFRLAVDAAQLGIWEIDLIHHTGHFSTQIGPMLGEAPGYQLPTLEAWGQHMHPDDFVETSSAFQKTLNGDAVFDVEYRVLWRDGKTIHWLANRGEIIRDAAGTPLRAIGIVLDITERKQREEKERFLTAFGERIRSFFTPEDILQEAVRSAVSYLNVSRCSFTEIDLVNDRFTPLYTYFEGSVPIKGSSRLSDYSQKYNEELRQGKTVVIHDTQADPRTADRFQSHYVPLKTFATIIVPLRKKGKWVASFAVSSADGPRYWTEQEIAAVEQIAERTELAVENVRLEAERHAAARATEESLARLDTLLAGSPVAFAMLDREFRFLRVNDAFARLNNITAEAHIGHYMREMIPEQWPILEPIYRRVLETGQAIINREMSGTNAAYPNLYKHWLSSYYPIRTSQGETIGLGLVVLEITERKQVEEEIRRLNEDLKQRIFEFETLFNIMPVGIVVAEDPNCHVVKANPAFSRWIGTEPGVNLSYCAPEHPYLGFKLYQDGNEISTEKLPLRVAIHYGKETGEHEIEVVRDDGFRAPLLAYASPLFDSEGNVRGSLGTFVDLTEIKRAQQERAQYIAEIEALNVRLQRAMSETHHRVKNNLQVISALINLQAMNHSDTVPVSELHRLTQHIKSLATIHELLTYQAKTDGEVTHISVKEALNRLMPTLQMMAGKRLIRADVADIRLPVRQGTTVSVLVNELVSNSLKHGDGVIGILCKEVEDKIHLSVRDEGQGFPVGFHPETAAHTGIELIESLSRWDLQGTVEYSNRPEGGACVVITFACPA